MMPGGGRARSEWDAWGPLEEVLRGALVGVMKGQVLGASGGVARPCGPIPMTF